MAFFGRKNKSDGLQTRQQEDITHPDKGVILPEEPAAQYVGRIGAIGKEQVLKAEQTLKEYKAGKANLERRIIENEQWYKLRHWEQIRAKKSNPGDPEPASAWLLNCIANKHADAMDNYPEPNVLPREKDDEMDAELLSSILPVILEQNEFEQTYSDMWWYKLKTGTGATGVFWSTTKNNGIGDIDIRDLDLLNLFWEPGITDIQKSRNLFHVDLIDRDLAEQRYPFLNGKLSSPTIDIAKYVYDDTMTRARKPLWLTGTIRFLVMAGTFCITASSAMARCYMPARTIPTMLSAVSTITENTPLCSTRYSRKPERRRDSAI